MTYNFSANFLKIQPPDTNFGQSWETLCYELLKAEFNDNSQIRLKAPDKGIDIYRQNDKIVYQCKSNENAMHGSIDIFECIKSIQSAIKVKSSISWDSYFIATNSNFTGNGYQKLQEFISENKLKNISQLGPEYWSELCEKHIEKVKGRLDYRLLITEQEVIEAFKKARYYDKYIRQYAEKISDDNFLVEVSNNRTPINLQIPFSPELTIENLLNVVSSLLNINMGRNNFYDTQTSAIPSISLTFSGNKQIFSKKINEVVGNEQPNFEFWIKIVWKDETQKNDNDENTEKMMNYWLMEKFNREYLSLTERKNITLSRTEKLLQNMMWSGVNSLKKN